MFLSNQANGGMDVEGLLGLNLSRSVLQSIGQDVFKWICYLGRGLNSRGTYPLIQKINILQPPKIWDSGI